MSERQLIDRRQAQQILMNEYLRWKNNSGVESELSAATAIGAIGATANILVDVMRLPAVDPTIAVERPNYANPVFNDWVTKEFGHAASPEMVTVMKCAWEAARIVVPVPIPEQL